MEEQSKGPVERVLNEMLSYTDHLVHNRPGCVVSDNNNRVGATWFPATYRVEGAVKRVFKKNKVGKRTVEIPLGQLNDRGEVRNNNRVVARYAPAGIFNEVARYMYKTVADVWKLDNEFVARWASYAFRQANHDQKVVLAAFLLVQNRYGEPIIDDHGNLEFFDENYRAVGEAMILSPEQKHALTPKHLLRVHDLLRIPEVAQINRDLGFTKSLDRPYYGNWPAVTRMWLRYRENNPSVMQGLVRSGYTERVRELARRSRYKPLTPKFFEVLKWKQKQSPEGHREFLDIEVKSDSWSGLSEQEACERILREKPSYLSLAAKVFPSVGITPAVLSAGIESGGISDSDLVILTPTLEEMGLLKDPDVKRRWEHALSQLENMRAAHVAKTVSTKEAREKLDAAAEKVVQTKIEKAMRNLRVYFLVDVSGSMHQAIEDAKTALTKILSAFPQDKVHVCVFNSYGRELKVPSASKRGVEMAFRGITASGGTCYASGVRSLQHNAPKTDEDVLFIFVGDQGAADFPGAVRQSGLRPSAFGLIDVPNMWSQRKAVENTARTLGIPCFKLDANVLEDAYALPEKLSNLIEMTPVGTTGQAPRVGLVDKIMSTPLLTKPAWAVRVK